MKKKIPYGISDFKLIREENYYFIDKTRFILEVENSDRYIMFLRPRRFGKSLFLAILEAYYDKFYKDDFELFFKDSYIFTHKTKEANSYHILKFDFSAIDVRRVEESFLYYLNKVLNNFKSRYRLNFSFDSTNPMDKINGIFSYFHLNPNESLYVMVDEYDNFANKLFLQNQSSYKNIISDKTAFFKQFFTILKVGASGNSAPIKRMFITGVTPMTMYDVTSGFNIASNISMDRNVNDMVGITQKELEQILEDFGLNDSKFNTQYLALLKEWYNNYIFNENTTEGIYNTDMILYFIKEYLKIGKIPKDLIDINVRSDYSKLRHLIYTNHKLNGNFEILKNLISKNTTSIDLLVKDFSALDLIKEENFKSLLFYQGLITIKESRLDLTLQIPNETIKRIDIDFLKDSLALENIFTLKTSKLSDYLKNFALNGDLETFKYIAKEIKHQTSIRDYIDGENGVKMIYIAYLSLTSYFVIKSEAELNKGFCDILIKPLNPYVEYFAIVELKYISRKVKGKKLKKEIETKKAKAIEQLNRYQNDEIVEFYKNNGKILKKIIIIFYGWKMILCEEINT